MSWHDKRVCHKQMVQSTRLNQPGTTYTITPPDFCPPGKMLFAYTEKVSLEQDCVAIQKLQGSQAGD